MNQQTPNGGTPPKDENIGSFYIGRRPPSAPERVLPKGGLTVLAIVAFAAIIWYAYPEGEEKYEGMDVPVIVAQKEVYKFTPDDPGGMEVRHQDSTVFDPLEKRPEKTVETLMPKPEEPMDTTEALKATAELAPKMDMQIQKLESGAEKFSAKADEAVQVMQNVTTPVAKPVAEASAPKAVIAAVDKKETMLSVTTDAAKAGDMVYIQLGSYRNTEGAAQDWGRLKKKHADILGSLQMRTQRVDLGSKGVFNRLQAGKVSEAKAKEICETLKSSNPGGCIVVH